MLKEIIISRYGSIGGCYDSKVVELKGRMPFSRKHFYELINGTCKNPGIKTLAKLADVTGVDMDTIINDYLEEEE